MLAACSTWCCRWNAAAAARRRLDGATPAPKTSLVRPDEPHLIAPRVDPGVPVFSLGRYAGPRRGAIVAVKEHGRTDLIRPLGAALNAGMAHLLGLGHPRRLR